MDELRLDCNTNNKQWSKSMGLKSRCALLVHEQHVFFQLEQSLLFGFMILTNLATFALSQSITISSMVFIIYKYVYSLSRTLSLRSLKPMPLPLILLLLLELLANRVGVFFLYGRWWHEFDVELTENKTGRFIERTTVHTYTRSHTLTHSHSYWHTRTQCMWNVEINRQPF